MNDLSHAPSSGRNWKLILGVAAIAICVMAAGAVWLLYGLTHDSTVDRFEKLRDGMTLQTAIAIMGRDPAFDQQEPNGSLMYGWLYQETTAAVVVYTRDGVTIRKKPFDDVGPPTLPDMNSRRTHIVRGK